MTTRTRPLRRRWACFPTAGERVSHAYALDEDGDWRSLCGRRVYGRHAGSPFHMALRDAPRTTPPRDDPSGCCLSCWSRSFPRMRTVAGDLHKRRTP